MDFRDFFDLSTQVGRYERLLREEANCEKNSGLGMYYHEASVDVAMAKLVSDKSLTCPSLVRVDVQPEGVEKHSF